MDALGQILERVMRASAWEMTPPPYYGTFHLTFTFVGIAVCILLAYFLRKTGEKGNRVVLLSTGLFLILTEIYKQIFSYYILGNGSYQWGKFPFHLCSVPMYLCVIAPFLPKGRVRDGMYYFMTTFNLLGGLMAFIEPSGITHPYWFMTMHAYIWHMTLIFIGAYLIASGRFAKTMKDYRFAVVCFVILCAVAFGINLAAWKVSDGGINMFFVGPRNSSLVVFKQISERFGWYVSTLLYIPTVCLGAFLVFLPAHLWAKRKKRAKA